MTGVPFREGAPIAANLQRIISENPNFKGFVSTPADPNFALKKNTSVDGPLQIRLEWWICTPAGSFGQSHVLGR